MDSTDTSNTQPDTVERRAPKVPLRFQPLYRRVVSGEGTRAECIKVKCLECMGWEGGPVAVLVRGVPQTRQASVTECIRRCPSKACPLYHVRPYAEGRSGGRQCLLQGHPGH